MSLASLLEGPVRSFAYDCAVLAQPGPFEVLVPVTGDVEAVDAAVRLFQIVFPLLSSQKHRTQVEIKLFLGSCRTWQSC